MLHKSAIYGLVGLVAGSAITVLSIHSTSKAQQQPPLASPSPGLTNTMPHHQGGRQQIDKHFIEMMIPHHQSAIEMADLALQKAQHPELKKLAAAIKIDQAKEIDQMKAWYKQWFGTEVPPHSMAGMEMHHPRNQQMPGGMSMHSGMMGMNMSIHALKNAPDFDKEFIRQMVPHHESAVMMARMAVNSAIHPQIRNLAEAMIKSQTAEIQQMQQWYQAWS